MIGTIGQCCDGSVYDLTDIGAALGNYIGSYGVQGVFKGIIVQGKGTHEKGGTGKGHQPHPVSIQLVDKIKNTIFRLFQTIGFDIFREHGF